MRKISNVQGIAPITVALRRQLNVMHAVILRDMRSRFFNHGLGFLIQPLMPVAHLVILLSIYTLTGRKAIFGDDLFLFFATGIVPSLTFTYVSRFMAISIAANKNMMAFPAVHLLDIVLARSFLEIIGVVISIIFIIIILISIGSNPYPIDPLQALLAMMATILVSIGIGIIVSVISAIFPIVPMVYSLSMVLVYLSAGGPIYIHSFPVQAVYIFSFNPIFHAVDWMRSAYYVGYPTQSLDKFYLIGFGMISLATGLLMERALRPWVLAK